MVIETLEKWNEVSDILRRMGYRRFVMQYSIDAPEGFHVWFGSTADAPEVEIVTRSQAVYDVIMSFQLD
jgi:hypothetical protein